MNKYLKCALKTLGVLVLLPIGFLTLIPQLLLMLLCIPPYLAGCVSPPAWLFDAPWGWVMFEWYSDL